MAMFEVEMEITGFRLKVKAQRNEDVARITTQLGRQLAGLTQPFSAMVDAPKTLEAHSVNDLGGSGESDVRRPLASKSGRKRIRRSGESANSTQPITWQHDAKAWGTPRQSWSAVQKILWTMYVLSKVAEKSELSGPVIAESFNLAFKQFGPLNKKSMPRDLGNLKKRVPAQIMDNPSATPITWYLTEEGIREGEKLVIEARGQAGT